MSSRVLLDAERGCAVPVQWTKENPAPKPCAMMPVEPQAEVDEVERIPVVEAERRIRETAEESFLRGKEEGCRISASEAEQALHDISERMAKATAIIAHMRPKLREQAESDVVKLALAIARRILNREIVADSESIHALVRVALEKIESRELTRVRVHACHAQVVKTTLQHVTRGQPVEVVADPAMQPGDLIIETSRGELDASIESQLKEIARGFADRLGN